MTDDRLTDPVLGDGRLLGAGERVWGSFQTPFEPTGGTVSVLANLDEDGAVPEEQRALFEVVEAGYAGGLPAVAAAVREEMGKEIDERRLPSADELQARIQLRTINVRYNHDGEASILLYFRTDPHQSDWYARISPDFRVEACGMKD